MSWSSSRMFSITCTQQGECPDSLQKHYVTHTAQLCLELDSRQLCNIMQSDFCAF